MNSKPADICVGIALCILSVVVFLYADNNYARSGVNSYGPDFFPKALSVIMFLASAFLILQAFLNREPQDLELINKQGFIRVAVTLLMAVAYLGSMQFVGFLLPTFVFLFLVMRFLGLKNLLVGLTTSGAIAAIIYSIFRFFLKIPLPEGIF